MGDSRADARGAAGPAPEISIVIVTYNSADVLGPCLQALPAAAEGVRLTDVFVVDNASADNTVELAAAASPVKGELAVTVVPTGRNAGYAAAVNVGVARSTARDAVLVLNPDTRLRAGAIRRLAEALAGGADRGVAVPRLVSPAGELQLSLRREPTLRTALGEGVLGGYRAGRYGGWGEMVVDPRRYARPGPVDWATGAVMMVSTQCLRTVGAWDESFLLYSEETDFALRARDRGYRVWYEPAAVAEHRGGASSVSPFLWSLLTVNRVRLYRRRHPALPAAVFQGVVLAGEGVRAAAGRATARAAVRALLQPSRRPGQLPS